MNSWQDVWNRLSKGQHVVLRGTSPVPEPDPARLRLVWVDCEAFPQPRGTLNEACRRMGQVLEVAHPLLDAAAGRLRAGVRRHLLGEAKEDRQSARYREAFQRALAPGQPRVALFLSGVDRADPASLELLTRLLEREGAIAWPLLLSFEGAELSEMARRLLERLESRLPAEAFWSESDPSGVEPSRPLPRLAPLPLRVLRAGATIGARFESEVLAELLQLDDLKVLGALQEAVDQGIEIVDRGQGIFRLEDGLAERVRQGILPSLARAWNERLAHLFGELPPEQLPELPAARSSEVPEQSSPAQPMAAKPIEPLGTVPAVSAEVPAAPAAVRTPAPALDPHEWFEGKPSPAPVDPRTEPWWERLNTDLAAARARASGAASAAAASPRVPIAPSRPEPPPSLCGPNEQRSAAHAEAAGRWETACEQHLVAAERASLAGEHARALELSSRVLALAERLDDPERRRQLQVRALLLVGRSRWQHHGAGADTSLQAALDAMVHCRALVLDRDPAQWRAELGSLIANVQYDMGTPEALEIALLELTRASQLLLEAGQPLDAARLLNDEAAVWVKIGDLVRANYLLSRSREVFSRVADSYPAARIELLETEHLLARLMLHAVPRPGRERDALQFGIEHGRAAEEGYRDLKAQWQLGRVWETLGRLELRLDHRDEAARLLEDARRLQQQLGDGLGLARSSGALCELLARAGDYPHALERLAESLELNADKGSRAGLELNLTSLKSIAPHLPLGLQDRARALGQRLEQELSSGEGYGARIRQSLAS
ncbi:MAG: tetratricopeptide repeat protein [Deltaproteobacteria bacterium]